MTKLKLDDAARARGEELVLDELFDLRLYERLRSVSQGGLAEMLDRLVAVEAETLRVLAGLFLLETVHSGRGAAIEVGHRHPHLSGRGSHGRPFRLWRA